MATTTKNSLVIVESPAKAKTITKYLGPGYEVKASMGHVRDLPKSKIGVDVDRDFAVDYQPIEGKEDVIRDLKKAAKKSEYVYLATDPDREGEAISWHLKELLELPDDTTYRVTFNEITQRVVKESIAANLPVHYADESHIAVGGHLHECSGPRTHVSNTGKIQGFCLNHEIVYDNQQDRYLLIGFVGETS